MLLMCAVEVKRRQKKISGSFGEGKLSFATNCNVIKRLNKDDTPTQVAIYTDRPQLQQI